MSYPNRFPGIWLTVKNGFWIESKQEQAVSQKRFKQVISFLEEDFLLLVVELKDMRYYLEKYLDLIASEVFSTFGAKKSPANT